MSFTQVGVVGAGTMGTNIALDFARAGILVKLTDAGRAELDRAQVRLQENLELLARHELLGEPVGVVAARVSAQQTLQAAVDGADLVVEAVSESLPLKQSLFAELDRLAPEAVLASNTSTLLPSLLAEQVSRPERLLVAHYWNPAHLIPLVELVPGPATDPQLVEGLRLFYLRIGKQPVVLRREKLGFIGNRLQFALYREALALLEEGACSVEDIDTVVRSSIARRLPVTGIFRTQDLGGLDVMAAICDLLFPDLDASREAPAVLRERVAAGRLGVKSGAGHYEYTPDEAERWRTALAEELIRLQRIDRDPGAS